MKLFFLGFCDIVLLIFFFYFCSPFSVFISWLFFCLHLKFCFPEFPFRLSCHYTHYTHSVGFLIQVHDCSWWLPIYIHITNFPWAPGPIWKKATSGKWKSKLHIKMIIFINRKTKGTCVYIYIHLYTYRNA